jgi:thiol-disulfide isomerase/thioredoxin
MVPRCSRILPVPRQIQLGLRRGATGLACVAAVLSCTPHGAPGVAQQQADFVLTPGGNYLDRGWIGIRVDTMPNGRGVLVTRTVPRSPASSAGIRAGDQLTQADGRPLEGAQGLVVLIRSRKPGSHLTLSGFRGGEPQVFDVGIEDSPDENGLLERTLVNLPAPALDGLVPLGSQAAPSWASLRGRVVVLDFWAPWCGVCHLVASKLNQWQQRFGERIAVVGIAAGPVVQVAQSAPRFHMNYLVVADPDERVVSAYDAFAVPLVLVVDSGGFVRAVSLGYSSMRLSKMEQLVEKLLIPS